MAVTFVSSGTDLEVGEINADDRMRPLSEAAVDSLVDAIGRLGFITRILVRRKKNHGYLLVDGAHRLEAMRRLGAATIPAVVVECLDHEARYLESDANLVGADLTPLDMAVFLSARRRAHQEMHPETRQGHAGATARWMQANSGSLASAIAEARGVTVRQVEKIMQAGDNLAPDEVTRLRAAPVSLTLKDLQGIARIGDPVRRYDVVDALATGRARKVSQALAQMKAPAAPMSAEDTAFLKMQAAWTRAPKAARRAFVAEFAAELLALMPDDGAA